MIEQRFKAVPTGMGALAVLALAMMIWARFSSLSIYDPYDAVNYSLSLTFIVTLSAFCMEKKNSTNEVSRGYYSAYSGLLLALILSPIFSVLTSQKYNIFKIFIDNQEDKLLTIFFFAIYIVVIIFAITILEVTLKLRPFSGASDEATIVELVKCGLAAFFFMAVITLILNLLARFTGARLLFSEDPWHHFLELFFPTFSSCAVGKFSAHKKYGKKPTLWDFLSDFLICCCTSAVYASLTHSNHNMFGFFFYETSTYCWTTLCYALIYFASTYILASTFKFKVWVYEADAASAGSSDVKPAEDLTGYPPQPM